MLSGLYAGTGQGGLPAVDDPSNAMITEINGIRIIEIVIGAMYRVGPRGITCSGRPLKRNERINT